MRCRFTILACFAALLVYSSRAAFADDEKPPTEKERPEKERPEKERVELRGPDSERIAIKEKLQAVLREADEAKKAGKSDRAEQLMEAARDLEARLRADIPAPERERTAIKEKIQVLRREADEAKKAGKGDRAEELVQAARELEAKLGKAIKPKEPPAPKEVGPDVLVDRIAKLRKGALHSLREGSKENAAELWAQADKLDRELRSHVDGLRGEAGPPAGRLQPPRPPRVERRVERPLDPRPSPDLRRPREGEDRRDVPPLNELRREIQQLRQELNEMREQMRRSHEEIERRDRPERDEPRRRPASL